MVAMKLILPPPPSSGVEECWRSEKEDKLGAGGVT